MNLPNKAKRSGKAEQQGRAPGGATMAGPARTRPRVLWIRALLRDGSKLILYKRGAYQRALALLKESAARPPANPQVRPAVVPEPTTLLLFGTTMAGQLELLGLLALPAPSPASREPNPHTGVESHSALVVFLGRTCRLLARRQRPRRASARSSFYFARSRPPAPRRRRPSRPHESGEQRGHRPTRSPLIRPLQERRRDRQAEGLGGLEVDDQLVLCRLHDGVAPPSSDSPKRSQAEAPQK